MVIRRTKKMKKFWQVGIIESKIFDGTVAGGANRDTRTRVLTFDALEDAITEYNKQVERVQATIEYSKRHKATEEIHSVVNIAEDGVSVKDPYWFEIDYKNGQIGTFEPIE